MSDKFWERIEKLANESGCWLWTGNLDSYGYGRFGKRKAIHKAHRISYVMHKGEIPTGMCVLHHCDTPSCVNPDHLYAGTHTDNNKDKVQRNRQAKGEKMGAAKLTPALVRDIRVIAKVFPDRFIAKHLGIGRTTITHIIKGVTWRHV
jgi:hypothetical protein